MTHTHKLANITISAIITIFAGMAVADDTSIYLGNASTTGTVQPNVLFILDTSGSMSNKDDTDPPITRLDRMKQALTNILNATNNINVGLMRFHDHGGPIIFPVADIGAFASDVEGGGAGNLTIAMSASDDDAEESATGAVTLDRDYLFLTHKYDDPTGIVSKRVKIDSDDAEEVIYNGSVFIDGSDLAFPSNGGTWDVDQMIGLRFQDIEIPKGANILSAALKFVLRDDADVNDPVTVNVWGEATDDAATFSSSYKNVSNRQDTTAIAKWEIPTGINVNDTFSTDYTTLGGGYDLSDVVEEITNRNGWTSGNNMAFFIEGESGDGVRHAKSYRENPDAAPLFTALYGSGTKSSQTVGIRFQGVNIPQGATITKAYLEFTAAADSPGTAAIKIQGEDPDSGSAAAFTTDGFNISGRAKTASSVTTQYGDAWTAGSSYQSDDLKEIVEEIVGDENWCGGNAMAFILTSTTDIYRIAHSYDGDSTRAPVLKVEYDPDTVAADACILQTVQVQIANSNDDAEERSNGSVDTNERDLEIVTHVTKKGSDIQTIGLRFPGIQIPKDTKIQEAHIIFTTDETPTDATSLTINGENVGDSAQFVKSKKKNPNYNITNRTTTTAEVNWNNIPTWDTSGEQHATPDLKTIVSEITSHDDWASGNAMSFIITGSGRRIVHSADSNTGGTGAILQIKVKGKLGAQADDTQTVRQRLIELIDGYTHEGWTPVLDTMYEAASYWRGEAAFYGRTRGQGSNIPPDSDHFPDSNNLANRTRVSNQASYTGGTLVQPGNCSNDNLNDDDCKLEYISGSPVYKSPITVSCQANYQILLTDGSPNYVHSVDQVKSLTDTSCDDDKYDKDGCYRELARFMRDNDQRDDLDDNQTVKTYTVGLSDGADDTFMTNIATDGGGTYEKAESTEELTSVFKAFFAEILSHTTSFTAPAVSVNAFNNLYHESEIYYSEFLPNDSVRWPGNLKKYKLCDQDMIDDSLCTKVGDILDVNNTVAVATSGYFDEDSKSLWSNVVDGNVVEAGGAGSVVPDYADRTIYTYTSNSAPDNASLNVTANIISADDAAPNADLDPATDENDGAVALKGKLDANESLNADEYSNLVYWIMGKDINNEDNNDSTDNRWAISSSLHAKPLVITYGKQGDDAISKIFLATNAGSLHMFNTYSGIEEWSFIPQVMLEEQKALMDNGDEDIIYGLDSDINYWTNDVNGNGAIEPTDGDKTYIFFGMRRGGRNIYAMDVTPTTALTTRSATGGIAPILKWRIEGGNTTGFNHLGQTWSPPKPAKIKYNGADRNVLIFGGGYDVDGYQDDGYQTSTTGNAIYIVDMETGALLWSASNDGVDGNSHLVLADMDYPIPSEVTVLDTNSDGYANRIYVGDTGGQIWRIDIGTEAVVGGIKAKGWKLASLSNFALLDASEQDKHKRKFFYAPDVALVRDLTYSNTQYYYMVTITSGDRANPSETTVHNNVYAIRDTNTSAFPASPTTITDAHLYDATANNIQSTDSDIYSGALTALKSGKGWYINLTANANHEWTGEKGLSATSILQGVLRFTTYEPDGAGGDDEDVCTKPVEGSGRYYAVNLLTGGAVYPSWDGNSSDWTREDRTYDANFPGIPPNPTIVFLPGEDGEIEGHITVGRTPVDESIGNLLERTFWYHDAE